MHSPLFHCHIYSCIKWDFFQKTISNSKSILYLQVFPYYKTDLDFLKRKLHLIAELCLTEFTDLGQKWKRKAPSYSQVNIIFLLISFNTIILP